MPTCSSWLNLVERFLALITDKAIRRSSIRSVKDLIGKIGHFVTHYNRNCHPFVWTATADSILAKLPRLTSRINGTGHSIRRESRIARRFFANETRAALNILTLQQ